MISFSVNHVKKNHAVYTSVKMHDPDSTASSKTHCSKNEWSRDFGWLAQGSESKTIVLNFSYLILNPAPSTVDVPEKSKIGGFCLKYDICWLS